MQIDKHIPEDKLPPPPPPGYFPPHHPHTDGPVPGSGPNPNIVHPCHPPHPPMPPKPCVGDPFMESANIQNVAQLRSYIKMMLGSPVICVEISDQQMNYIIADTVRYIQRYYYRMGNYRDYLMLELQQVKHIIVYVMIWKQLWIFRYQIG